MKKVLIYICIFIVFLFGGSIIIGRSLISHINYNNFVSNVKYFSTPIEYVYNDFKQNKEIFIDDKKINNIEELIDKSEYVLKIKIVDNPTFYGNGIINNAKILEIIKGEDKNIYVGNEVKIYDLISYWSGDYINYYGGMTPLNPKNEYIVFLKKAENANQEGAYIFSSIRYGYFNISTLEANILTNYIQGSLTVQKIMEYDYVEMNCDSSGYNSCDNYAEDYSKLKRQLFNYMANG